MLISGKIDPGTNQCHDLLDLMNEHKREGEIRTLKNHHYSESTSHQIYPHAINNKPPDVTGTLQKQNSHINSTESKKHFEGHRERLCHGWLPLCVIYGHGTKVQSVDFLVCSRWDVATSSHIVLVNTDILVSQIKWAQTKHSIRGIKLKTNCTI